MMPAAADAPRRSFDPQATRAIAELAVLSMMRSSGLAKSASSGGWRRAVYLDETEHRAQQPRNLGMLAKMAPQLISRVFPGLHA